MAQLALMLLDPTLKLPALLSSDTVLEPPTPLLLKLQALALFSVQRSPLAGSTIAVTKLAFFGRQPIDLDRIREIGSLHLGQRRGERFQQAKQVRRVAGLCGNFL